MTKPGKTKKAGAAKSAATKGAPAEPARVFAIEAARVLSDEKCDDIQVLDVRQLSQVTDYLVIGTGTSDRQMRSALHHVEEKGSQSGYRPFRSNADDRGTWLLSDFVHVVVHVFEPNTRAHYDLEMLWGDAERVAWERQGKPVKPGRNRAGLTADESTR